MNKIRHIAALLFVTLLFICSVAQASSSWTPGLSEVVGVENSASATVFLEALGLDAGISAATATFIGNATAATFFGDGSNLTGIIHTDTTKVLKSGDTMTGLLVTEAGITSAAGITASTNTITASAFSGDGSAVTGVDADTLDTLDSTAFTLKAGDTMTGALTVEGGITTDSDITAATGTISAATGVFSTLTVGSGTANITSGSLGLSTDADIFVIDDDDDSFTGSGGVLLGGTATSRTTTISSNTTDTLADTTGQLVVQKEAVAQVVRDSGVKAQATLSYSAATPATNYYTIQLWDGAAATNTVMQVDYAGVFSLSDDSSSFASFNPTSLTASRNYALPDKAGTMAVADGAQTLITNLNADLLDGNEASAFATDTHGHEEFVELAGDTMTGTLINNATNTAHAIVATHGLGPGNAIFATSTSGTGDVAHFEIDNAAAVGDALSVANNGAGYGVYGLSSGAGTAGYFNNSNAGNTATALSGITAGTSATSYGVYGSGNGSGRGVYGLNNGAGTGVLGSNTSTGNAVTGFSNGGSGYGIYGLTNSTTTGKAGFFENTNAANYRAPLSANTHGTGNLFELAEDHIPRLYVDTNGALYASGSFNAASGTFGIATDTNHAVTARHGNGAGNALFATSTSGTGDVAHFEINNVAAVGDALHLENNGAGFDLSTTGDYFTVAKNGALKISPPSTALGIEISHAGFNSYKIADCFGPVNCGGLSIDFTGKVAGTHGINMVYASSGSTVYGLNVTRTDDVGYAAFIQGGLTMSPPGLAVIARPLLKLSTTGSFAMWGLEIDGPAGAGLLSKYFIKTHSYNTNAESASAPVYFNHTPVVADTGAPSSVRADLDFSPLTALTYNGTLFELRVTGNATGTLNADVIDIYATATTGTIFKADNYGSGNLFDLKDEGTTVVLVENDGSTTFGATITTRTLVPGNASDTIGTAANPFGAGYFAGASLYVGGYGVFATGTGLLVDKPFTINTSVADALVIGDGTDGKDFSIKFNGHDNQSSITWLHADGSKGKFELDCDLEVEGIHATEHIHTDVLIEETFGSGILVDDVLIRDGSIEASGSISTDSGVSAATASITGIATAASFIASNATATSIFKGDVIIEGTLAGGSLPTVLQFSEETIDTTTSVTYQEAFRATATLASGTYAIHYTAEIGQSGTDKRASARLQIDDLTTIAEIAPTAKVVDVFHSLGGVYFLSTSGDTHHFDFDFSAPDDGTTTIRRKRIIIMEVIE